MEDHGTVVPEQAGARVVVGRAGVNDDGFAGVGRERELGVEELLLRGGRRVVAEVVEAGLADRDGARVREQLLQLVERSKVEARRLVRVDAEDGWTSSVASARAGTAGRLRGSSRRRSPW